MELQARMRGHFLESIETKRKAAEALEAPVTGGQLILNLRAEGDPAEGYRLAIQAILASPYLLYRAELGVDQGDGTYRVRLTVSEGTTFVAQEVTLRVGGATATPTPSPSPTTSSGGSPSTSRSTSTSRAAPTPAPSTTWGTSDSWG